LDVKSFYKLEALNYIKSVCRNFSRREGGQRKKDRKIAKKKIENGIIEPLSTISVSCMKTAADAHGYMFTFERLI